MLYSSYTTVSVFMCPYVRVCVAIGRTRYVWWMWSVAESLVTTDMAAVISRQGD